MLLAVQPNRTSRHARPLILIVNRAFLSVYGSASAWKSPVQFTIDLGIRTSAITISGEISAEEEGKDGALRALAIPLPVQIGQ